MLINLMRGALKGAGCYHLLIYNGNKRKIRVGSLGLIEFGRGYYGYTGSARSGFAGRVGRHLRNDKNVRWHIDYLLRQARVSQVWMRAGAKECVSHVRFGAGGISKAVDRFGCGDCKCGSHLWLYADKPSAPDGWRVVDIGGIDNKK